MSTAPDGARERLRTAAVAAFAERGFHGTTTRDIATAAGMSPAALYVFHASKEHLLFELCRTGHETILELVRAADSPAAAPAERLSTFMRTFAVHHARAHTEARIVNYELASLTAEHRAEILALRTGIEALARDIVDAGVATGDFDVPHPHLSANALMSLGIDIARWYREDGSWSPEHIAEAYSAMALRLVGAPA